MSEPPLLPAPEPEPAPEPPIAPRARHSILPWLSAAGFVVLAVAIVWVWLNPMLPPPPPQSGALEQQVAALEARVAHLERQPPTAAPNLTALDARVAALEQRQPATAAPPPNLGPLTARLDALEHQQAADLAPMEVRISRLEDVGHKVVTDVTQKLASEDARFAALEKSSSLAVRIGAARQALDAGHKLGDVSGAPPALARYATVDPPTEAYLRLAFPAASQAALAASRPSVDGQPLLSRIWARAQDLVTIRRASRCWWVILPPGRWRPRGPRSMPEISLVRCVQSAR